MEGEHSIEKENVKEKKIFLIALCIVAVLLIVSDWVLSVMIYEENQKMRNKSLQDNGNNMQREKFDLQTMKRLLAYMKFYKNTLIVIVVCILLSALAGAASSLFLQTLIDDYIVPLLGMDEPVFTGLLHVLITIGMVYLIGIAATLIYNRLAVSIAQGTLKEIRDEMFEKMQKLRVRYFDSHTNGDIMSL